MWIDPDEAEVVRVEFSSALVPNLGPGVLGRVSEYQGFMEQRKALDGRWLPSRQGFVVHGRELRLLDLLHGRLRNGASVDHGFYVPWSLRKVRIRQVSEFADYVAGSGDGL
jgi:hypothetical protein